MSYSRKIIFRTVAIASIGIVGKLLLPKSATRNITKEVINSDKVFGGVDESALNQIAKSVSRGVKACIDGDELKYIYKSASGKKTYVASFFIDKTGKIIGRAAGNGVHYQANSPRIFMNAIKGMF